jgi:riboflavin biosynthesis pyrimidine reductase
MEPWEMITTLFEEPGLPSVELPPALRSAFDGNIGLASPVLYVNFVASVDGVAAFTDGTPPSAISGGSSSDRLVMGLLRAFADAVLIGAGTLRTEPEHLWTAGSIYPEMSQQFASLRRDLDLAENPRLIVLTRSGKLDPSSRALHEGALVVTTDRGAAALPTKLPPHCQVVSMGERVSISEALRLLRSEGTHSILSEGGPQVLAQLLDAGAVDELFLTLAPSICGRSGHDRLGLVEGLSFDPSALPRLRLLSVRQSGDELFLRYRARS